MQGPWHPAASSSSTQRCEHTRIATVWQMTGNVQYSVRLNMKRNTTSTSITRCRVYLTSSMCRVSSQSRLVCPAQGWVDLMQADRYYVDVWCTRQRWPAVCGRWPEKPTSNMVTFLILVCVLVWSRLHSFDLNDLPLTQSTMSLRGDLSKTNNRPVITPHTDTWSLKSLV